MWKFGKKEITTLKQCPENVYGFIYLITIKNPNTQKKYYIGKKNFFFERKINISKKQYEQLNDKRLKKYKINILESDWLDYKSSCIPLLEEIKNENIEIEKTILEFCFSKRELTYKEVKYLFKYEVLERNDFFNNNILNKFFDNVLD